jgi:transcriptional regulator with XRE-family HTH domain
MNEKAAKKLEYLRKQKGLTQRQLAEKIGVSRDLISKWERSETSPDTDHLVALANLYNVSIDEMINSKEEKVNMQEAQRAEFFGYDEKSDKKKKDYPKAYNFPFPIVVVIVYLLLGFYKNFWHPGWLIFMTIPLYYFVVSLFDKEKTHEEKTGWWMIPYSILTVVVYFLVGYYFDLWHPTWLIFLTIPLFYFVVSLLTPTKDGEQRKFWLVFPYPLVAVAVFFMLGYFLNLWHPGWLIFMTIPLYYYLVDIYYKKKAGSYEGNNGWKMFPFPILVTAIYLILGFVFNLWHPTWIIFLTIPIWGFYFGKDKNKNKDDDVE